MFADVTGLCLLRGRHVTTSENSHWRESIQTYRERIPHLLVSVNALDCFEALPVVDKFKNNTYILSPPYLSRHHTRLFLDLALSSACPSHGASVHSPTTPTSSAFPSLWRLKSTANQPLFFLISSSPVPQSLPPFPSVSFTFRKTKISEYPQQVQMSWRAQFKNYFLMFLGVSLPSTWMNTHHL